MYVKIIRGINQIGGNIIEVGTDSTKIILDCGSNLPDIDAADYVDNIEIDGLTTSKSMYNAIFLSHYHGDHVGLLGRINKNIPIYASIETEKVINIINDFISHSKYKINILNPYEAIWINEIKITPYQVTHSAKGAFMYLIEADGKSVLYSGDFCNTGRLPKNVDLMLCEGTNIAFDIQKDIVTENEISELIYSEITKKDTICFVLASSANIDRVKSVLSACQRAGKNLVTDLFTLSLLGEVHTETEWIKYGFDRIIAYPERFYDKNHGVKFEYFSKHKNQLKPIRKIAEMNDIVFYSRTATIKLAMDIVKPKNSKIIYSMWKGYKSGGNVKNILEYLQAKYKPEIVDIHSSGHAYRRDIEHVVKWVKPKILVPIHTENQEEFENQFNNVKFAENGEIIYV